MTLSLTTIIVVTFNALAGVVAAALLMLVLWQAPRHRMNQLFALVMLALGAYSATNAMGRFVDDLHLDARIALYVAISFFAIYAIAIFFFAVEFAQVRTPIMLAMRATGYVIIAVNLTALWTDNMRTNIRPLEGGDYTADFTLFGYFAVATLMLYMTFSAVVLYRHPDERARSLWPAPLLVICNTLASTFIWPFFHIPLGALFLAASGVALGLPVLRYELFNPLANLNAALAEKNKDLREVSEMKSRFLASMSHELRTPLNSIIGYTELIMNGTYGALNDTQRDRLEKVIRNGHNLLDLINGVLDLNRIETGQITLESKRVATADLLNGVLDLIAPLASEKGLTFTRQFDSAPPLHADETRVRQIITNIVANAVKFTPRGSVTVRAFPANGMVQFEIEDTGIGIPADQINRVFEEFQRVEQAGAREYEGTGLGMTITKRLVEMHGGRIWLTSQPGQGTTFFVTLPAAPVAQAVA
jgi:signal transduction histidine kinase